MPGEAIGTAAAGPADAQRYMALVAAATDRLMVQVQSTLFPLYDRNPQTFVPNIMFAHPADFRPATMTVEHGPDGRSAVLLPVVH